MKCNLQVMWVSYSLKSVSTYLPTYGSTATTRKRSDFEVVSRDLQKASKDIVDLGQYKVMSDYQSSTLLKYGNA